MKLKDCGAPMMYERKSREASKLTKTGLKSFHTL
jgi:hypothetical protein